MQNAAESNYCQGEENVQQDSHVSKSSTYWFPVYEGLFGHAQTIRDAVWFFMWLIARTTVERDGEGRVLGGVPIDDGRPAREIGVSVKVIRRWRRILLGGYILAVRTPVGFKYTLLKSKKYQYSDRPKLPITQKVIGQNGHSDRQDRAGRSAGSGSFNKKIQGQHREDGRGGGVQPHAPQTGAPPTATNQSTPVLKDCWTILGLTMPIGGAVFQGEWEAFYDHHTNPDAPVVDVMEEFIQFKLNRWQKGIPPKFYDLKHELEAELKQIDAEVVEAQRWVEAQKELEAFLPASSGTVILMEKLPAQAPALPARAGQTKPEAKGMTERQALAIVLRDNNAIETHPEIKKMGPEDFKDEKHQTIFYGMRRMLRTGQKITVGSLIEWLKQDSLGAPGGGVLRRAGGEAYVRSLADDAPGKAATA